MNPEKIPSVHPGSVTDEVTVGTVIAGKYRIEARLGSGGMGTVWLCTHLALGEKMAIKIVSTSTALSRDVRARFAREARASARLKSRFSVHVFDSGELPNGTPYIVMEYLQGETLREYLRRASVLPLAEAVGILIQVARGLERAHAAGIVHRDIKPDNIFLAETSDDGLVAKVFDFGVAKLTDAAHATETVAGTFVGTPQFMSPEQAMGQPDVDHRADVYSLGVLAYRMLAGRPLYDSSSIPALLFNICNGPLPKLRDTLPELPLEVEAWFQKTCARDRDLRYGSASECAEALIVAAGMSISKLAAPDSYLSGTHRALGTANRPFAYETPIPDSSGPMQSSVSRRVPAPSWRGIAIAMSALAVLAVVASVVLLHWGRERRVDSSQAPTVQDPTRTRPATPAPIPTESGAAPVVAPVDLAPPASAPASSPPRPAGRPGHPLANPRPATGTTTPAPKYQEPVAAPASPAPNGANSAITDVGY